MEGRAESAATRQSHRANSPAQSRKPRPSVAQRIRRRESLLCVLSFIVCAVLIVLVGTLIGFLVGILAQIIFMGLGALS